MFKGAVTPQRSHLFLLSKTMEVVVIDTEINTGTGKKISHARVRLFR